MFTKKDSDRITRKAHELDVLVGKVNSVYGIKVVPRARTILWNKAKAQPGIKILGYMDGLQEELGFKITKFN